MSGGRHPLGDRSQAQVTRDGVVMAVQLLLCSDSISLSLSLYVCVCVSSADLRLYMH